jgi:hypothetical protein
MFGADVAEWDHETLSECYDMVGVWMMGVSDYRITSFRDEPDDTWVHGFVRWVDSELAPSVVYYYFVGHCHSSLSDCLLT